MLQFCTGETTTVMMTGAIRAIEAVILTDPGLLQLHKVEQIEEHGATLSAANGFRRSERQKQSTCLKLMDRSLCLYDEHRKYQSHTPGEDEIL